MRKDDLLIFEAYKSQQIDEAGALDRMGANWAATKANYSFGNIGKRVAGAAARGLGSVVGGQAGQTIKQAGQQLKQQANSAGNDAKINKILSSHKVDIDKVSQAIVTDLDKLKLNPTGIRPDAIANPMYSQLNALLKKQMGASTAAPTAAPEAPVAAPEAPVAAPEAAASAPVASGVGSGAGGSAPVVPTNTATDSAAAMASTDAGSTKTKPEVDSEAGEAVSPEEAKKREEYRKSAVATMTGKPPAPDAASTETKPEEPKANPADIKKNIAKNRTATGASGFKGSTAAKSPEPEAPIPADSTFVTKKGVKFIYNSDGSNAWEKVLKSGNTEEVSHPEDQKQLSDLWRKQQSAPAPAAPAKPEPKRSEDLVGESFKSFFWNF